MAPATYTLESVINMALYGTRYLHTGVGDGHGILGERVLAGKALDLAVLGGHRSVRVVVRHRMASVRVRCVGGAGNRQIRKSVLCWLFEIQVVLH